MAVNNGRVILGICKSFVEAHYGGLLLILEFVVSSPAEILSLLHKSLCDFPQCRQE